MATTTLSQPVTLRKRMRAQDRAASPPSIRQQDVIQDLTSKHEAHEELPSPPQTESEVRSNASGPEDSMDEDDGDEPPRPSHLGEHHHSPHSQRTKAWYEFDLAVVVALVSPLGQWLTGGDHIKNLLLISLLVFYLHQIIEVPWSLYQKSRPRTRAASIAAWKAPGPNSPEARYTRLATSELHKLEFLFLFLTFVSPLLGACLLRYATAAVLGPDAVSWFSTVLFVLATGMRPWTHLVDRLNQRTEELQDFVHYPSAGHGVPLEEHDALVRRLAHLEKGLAKIKAKVDNATEDVYDYVDDAVDAVEHAMRKQERKWDRCEDKINEVEQVLSERARLPKTTAHPLNAVKGMLTSTVDNSALIWLASLKRLYYDDAQPSPSKLKLSRSRSGFGMHAPTSSLETIVEEENPVYMDSPQKDSSTSLLLQPYYLTTALVYQVGYILTSPLRVVGRMLTGRYT